MSLHEAHVPGAQPRVPLPITPYDDESLPGYFLRTAEENVYGSLYWITDLAGISAETRKTDFVLMARHVEALSQVVGCAPETLRAMGYEGGILRDQYRVQAFGTSLPVPAIEHQRPKVCPECLKERPYIRQHWDLSVMTACPIHGRRMLTRCPGCGKPINWGRKSVTSCRCGYDFSSAVTDAVSPAAQSMVRSFYNLLCSIESKLPVDVGFPNELAGQSFDSLVALVTYLGRVARDRSGVCGPRFHRADIDLRHDIIEAAGGILSRWPSNWHALVRRVRDRRNRKFTGIKKMFGSLYGHLYQGKAGGCSGLLQLEFERYIEHSGIGMEISSKGCSMVTKEMIQLPYYTARGAMKMIGCNNATLERLIETGVLELETKDGSDVEIHRITRESVDAYCFAEKSSGKGHQRQKPWVTKCPETFGVKEIMEILGMKRGWVDRYLHNGILPAVARPANRQRVIWRVAKQDVINFRDRLNANCRDIGAAGGGALFDYQATISKLNAAKVTSEQMIGGILNSDLKPYAERKPPVPLKEMKFAKVDLDEFIEFCRRLPSGKHVP